MLEDALFCSPKEFLTACYGFMHFGFFVSFESVNNGLPRIRILLFKLKNWKNLRVMLFVNALTLFLKGHKMAWQNLDSKLIRTMAWSVKKELIASMKELFASTQPVNLRLKCSGVPSLPLVYLPPVLTPVVICCVADLGFYSGSCFLSVLDLRQCFQQTKRGGKIIVLPYG